MQFISSLIMPPSSLKETVTYICLFYIVICAVERLYMVA